MKIFAAFVLSLCSSFSFSQTLTYEVVLFGDVIGKTTIQKTTDTGGVVKYLLRSSSTAKVFFVTRRSSQYYSVTYRNNQLVSVDATNKVDDDVNEVKMKWDGKRYSVQRNKVQSYINEAIRASTLTLYFTEPSAGKRIFSERLGEFYAIDKNSDGSYEYELSDNIKTTCRYINGVLSKMEMRKNLVTVTLRLVKS